MAFQARSYLDNHFTTQGSDVNVVASMVDTTQGRGDRRVMLSKEALPGSIDSAVASVKSPSGERYRIALNDEGINGDKVAGAGRLIQSVGTPYQGTALAGNLAALGDVFGAGCGYNTDLTYSGSTNCWSYDYCHLATDLFLDDPEDGTTEKWAG